MATLTEVSVMARKIIKWGLVVLVIMALIPGIMALMRRVYLTLNPPPPPPPTVKYGKLPKLIFPEAPILPLEYKPETITELCFNANVARYTRGNKQITALILRE
jgi:hypothetical protein